MNKTLNRRYFNIWLDLGLAERLERVAAERKIDEGDVVREIVQPVLGGEDGETTGRFILLRVPEQTYKQHLAFFDGDSELTKASMVGSLVCTGEDFANAMKAGGGGPD